ncbi:MAG TPA: hypothetical protein VGK37_17020 [Casimicrobiaceae bacterium]|jgi:hypothetical protein
MEPGIDKELYKVVDALVALKHDLSCDPHIPGETLVLSASKSRDACDALDAAFSSVRHVIASLNGGAAGEGARH